MFGYFHRELLCLVPVHRKRLVLHRRTENTPWINTALVLPDGRVLTGSHTTTSIWSKDLQRCTILQEFQTSQCVLASLTCDRVVTVRYANNGLDSSMILWDTNHCVKVVELACVCEYMYCMVGLWNERLVTSGSFGVLRCWDLRGPFMPGKRLQYDTYVNGSAVEIIALTDGRIMYCGGFNGTKIWDLAQGSVVVRLAQSQPHVVQMLQLFDQRVILAGVDAVLRVWALATNTCLIVLAGHVLPRGPDTIESISGLAELPDGRVVSSGYDTTLRVWDATTGQCLFVLRRHQCAVVQVLVSEGLVYSGDISGRVHIWE